MSNLPPEIITNILIRLPVKSLLRFRCVSKSWRAEIDGSYFINLHLTRSITTGSNHFPICLCNTLYSLDSNSLEKLENTDISYINPHTLILISICNGLLLLLPFDGDCENFPKLIIFNPSTRKHFVLPTPPPKCKHADLIPIMESSYLGYDVINDDYKVFIIRDLADQDKNFVTAEARIYSLKSNLWHIVKDFTKGVIFNLGFDFVVYVNGALYSVNDTYYTTIVALDVGKETFNLIPMPNIGGKNVSHLIPHVFDGRLAVLCMYPDNRTDIWVMNQYGVKESWSMFLSVKPEISDFVVIPLVYSKSRTEVLLSYSCEKLVWYDLRRKTVRGFGVSGLPVRFDQVCVESLVSVGGTGKTDEKRKQHEDEK